MRSEDSLEVLGGEFLGCYSEPPFSIRSVKIIVNKAAGFYSLLLEVTIVVVHFLVVKSPVDRPVDNINLKLFGNVSNLFQKVGLEELLFCLVEEEYKCLYTCCNRARGVSDFFADREGSSLSSVFRKEIMEIKVVVVLHELTDLLANIVDKEGVETCP